MKRERSNLTPHYCERVYEQRQANSACDKAWVEQSREGETVYSGTTQVTVSCKSKKRKSNGFYPVRPFSITKRTQSPGISNLTADRYSIRYGCHTYHGEGALGFYAREINLDIPDYSSALQGCVNAACANAQSDAFNAFTTLAEGAKSLKTIKDVTSTIFARSNVLLEKTAKANRKYYRSKASHSEAYFALMQDFNNIWLLGRYGLRPMVHDVKNFVDTYRYPPKIRKRGSASRTFDISGSLEEVTHNSATAYRVYNTTASGSLKVRAGGWAEIPSNRDSKLIHKGNLAETAWDLVPISFLVDKIVDVKSFLINNTTSGCDLRSVWGSVKLDLQYDTSQEISYFGAIGDNRRTGGYKGNASLVVESYQRWPMAVSNVPPLDLRFDTLTWVDFASIVTSKYRLFEKVGHNIIKRL